MSSNSQLRPTPHAFAWQSGTIANTRDNDCLLFDPDGNPYYSVNTIIGTWVSYFGDLNAGLPKVGDIYYTSVFARNIAACQPASVHPWLILPSNTSLAISGVDPVICLRNLVATTVGCSQSLSFGTSLSGASGYSLGIWSVAQGGGSVEILVPVSSSSPGTILLQARVDTADGWANPWVTPSKSFFMTSNAPPPAPTVDYPATPTTLITATTATTTTNILNHYAAGTLYMDIGTTTSYGTSNAGNAVPNTWDSGQFYTNWTGLSPGTLYHWRGRFVPSVGSTVFGADRTFTTAGTVTVPTAPGGMSADAVPGQISLGWVGVVGATSYQIYRRGQGSTAYSQIGTSTITAYADTTALADNSYLYRVRAVNGAGSSVDSASALATMIIFTDDFAVAQVTIVKAVHLAQLRTAVNALRALAGISPGVYTDSATPGLVVKAVHVEELRIQLNGAMQTLGFSTFPYVDVMAPGVAIRTYHFQQLRDRVK